MLTTAVEMVETPDPAEVEAFMSDMLSLHTPAEYTEEDWAALEAEEAAYRRRILAESTDAILRENAIAFLEAITGRAA